MDKRSYRLMQVLETDRLRLRWVEESDAGTVLYCILRLAIRRMQENRPCALHPEM
jgi:hypothetical protein